MNDESVSPADGLEDEEWRKLLVEGHRPSKILRAVFHRLPSEPRCKFCHNPFGGFGGRLVSLLGYRPSRKNPNLCRQCCEAMTPGGAEIDVAILFADVRGSTTIAESMSAAEFAALMNRFYIAATRALIQHDAIIDKLVGDEVMALFIPGIAGPSYRRRAVAAAEDLIRAVASLPDDLPVGIGIHAGNAFVGAVGGDDVSDFTALGDAVNTASRLQGIAGPGEIVLTESMFASVSNLYPHAGKRLEHLRGKEDAVTLYVVPHSSHTGEL